MSKFIRIGKYVKPNYPIYIGSKAVQKTKSKLDVLDKFTGESVSVIPMADKEFIEESIKQCTLATEAMKKLTPDKKKAILLEIADKIKARQEEFAKTIVVEVGKPWNDAIAEVGRAIDTFTIAAEESVRQTGQNIPLEISSRNVGFQAISKRFPIGPISMISPFNFPLNLVAHKIAPAIAAGCPFVLKPSDRTPLSALLVGEVLSESKLLPEGAFSIFPTTHEDAPLLSTDERIKLITFTGSPGVGWKIKDNAGKKKVVLELGGDAACIVDSDIQTSKLQHIANRILFGGFYSQGQSCISIQRVYIHEKHYDALKQLLVQGASQLNLKKGDPMDPNTFLGPMITEDDAKRVNQWVHSAVKKGANLLIGGKQDGKFHDLTILENPPKDTEVCTKEIFGPVFYIQKFTDFKDTIKQVNASEFGLQSGVFTDNINKAYFAFNNIDAGAVVINDIPSVRVDSQAYGGIKNSGFGREGIINSIEEYTELKLMILKDIGTENSF
ncbi:aldehyde dehydrogenase [Tieghemostelium lacteum]|uniref:NADP-dependent glyceraldehyde-3-phosphate dehydrogenase n=1 Tax=Tieghemostelium lacteum TaxID=361077 RepID=A0A151Z5T8_TIELA|nr:aldehyde dehydrogenase [Tieghemostelium lacteum]|eukprot:KYQ89320.1 aldehyde dehydrogenase [Tieghemostelium lacteum]